MKAERGEIKAEEKSETSRAEVGSRGLRKTVSKVKVQGEAASADIEATASIPEDK